MGIVATTLLIIITSALLFGRDVTLGIIFWVIAGTVVVSIMGVIAIGFIALGG